MDAEYVGVLSTRRASLLYFGDQMGMYTELNIGVEFKKDTPKDVIQAISYMCDDNEDKQIDFKTDHELFQTERWKWMLRSAGSYYFDTTPQLSWRFDTISKTNFLSFVTNIKNYSGEWQEFLKFIAPYVNEGYIGTYRYEEDEKPTLVFIDGGKAYFEYTVKNTNSRRTEV